MLKLICPLCKNKLEYSTNIALCGACKKSWPIIDDIIDMLSDKNYNYEYEYSKTEMQKLLALSKEKGWFYAINSVQNIYGQEWQQYFIDYNTSKERAPWLKMITNKDSVVLDYGCGFGPISYLIAQQCNSVLSIDASFDRLSFWRTRAKQDGLNNVTFLAWDGKYSSPIPENSFDAIILNGVLEWIPESIRDGNPLLVQIKFLKYCESLLKRNGKLLLAIENRFALQYFLGAPDHHSELLFGTLFPRFLANYYSLLFRKCPYRVYTHSLNKYLEMLKISGYNKIEKYEIFPLYQFPKVIVDLIDENGIRNIRHNEKKIEHKLIRILTKLNIAKYFVFTYLFIASKD